MKNTGYIDILIIEDDQDDSELTLQALQEGDNHIRIVHMWDGAAALKFISDMESSGAYSQMKLILLNLNLPKLNGLEVLEKIRDSKRLKATPVVILSSSMDAPTISKAYEMGANSYVLKPSRFESYVDAVSSLVTYWSTINELPNN